MMGAGGCASMVRLTVLTQGMAPTLARAAFSKSSFMGQAGVVSSSLKETMPDVVSMERSLMKPQSTMFMPKSGSIMVESAASTSDSLDIGEGVDEGMACVDVFVILRRR